MVILRVFGAWWRRRAGLVVAAVLAVALTAFPVRADDWRMELAEAWKRLQAHDVAGSRQILDRLEKAHPENAEILYAAGNVHLADSEDDAAETRFLRMKAVAPTDLRARERLMYLDLLQNNQARYDRERADLLDAYRKVGGVGVKHSPSFYRQFFNVNKTTNVDAFEYYPDQTRGSRTRYYRFVMRGTDGADKGILVLSSDAEENVFLREAGRIPDGVTSYAMDHYFSDDSKGRQIVALVGYFREKEPPAYEAVRQMVIDYIYGRLKPIRGAPPPAGTKN